MITRPDTSVPRVEIPDLTEAEREISAALREKIAEADAHAGFIRATQWRMAGAMAALGKPIFKGKAKPRKKPSRNLAYAERVRARSESLAAKRYREAVGIEEAAA